MSNKMSSISNFPLPKGFNFKSSLKLTLNNLASKEDEKLNLSKNTHDVINNNNNNNNNSNNSNRNNYSNSTLPKKDNSKSIDLSYTEDLDQIDDSDEDYEDEDEDEEEEVRLKRIAQKKASKVKKVKTDGSNINYWNDTIKRPKIIHKLVKYFSKLITNKNKEIKYDDSDDSEDEYDHNGRVINKKYSKGMNAIDMIVNLIDLLDIYENDRKDFTIYLCDKNIIKSTLKILLELCAPKHNELEFDRALSVNCIKLILKLTRGMTVTAIELLTKPIKKAGTVKTEIPEGNKNYPKDGFENPNTEGKERFDTEMEERENAFKQLSVLMSFKDTFCSEKIAKAIMSVYKYAWIKEYDTRIDSEQKKDIHRCLNYLRRQLQIDVVGGVSSRADIANAGNIHCRLITHFKPMLATIPVICIDLMMETRSKKNNYHDPWLTDVLQILFHLIRGFTAKDFFHVWNDGRIVSEQELNHDFEDENFGQRQNNDIRNNSKHITSFSNKHPIGELKNTLERERDTRKQNNSLSRHSRFGGVFKKSISSNISLLSSSSEGKSGASIVNTNSQSLSQNPFGGNNHPQAQSKKKKSLTFVAEDASLQSNLSYVKTVDGSKACTIVANIIDRLCTSGGLNQLVLRIIDEVRRDENTIGIEHEIMFMQIVSICLQYNRLKIAVNKRNFDKRQMSFESNLTSTDPSGITGWVPGDDLRNVASSLDNPPWKYVLGKLFTFGQDTKTLKDVYIPMELYKEMICYLKIMLDSSNIDHHEIAIRQMFYLFYTTSERTDPLSKLLHGWKPNHYTRNHLNILVELVHETMKLLDSARDRFKDAVDEKKSKIATKKQRDNSIENYIIGCLRFNTGDYFRRLVGNHSVHLYTRLLRKFDTNEPNINYYAYIFLQRLWNVKLDQDIKAPNPPVLSKATLSGMNAYDVNGDTTQFNTKSDDATLGYMLFNVNTMSVISEILNSYQVDKNKDIIHLISLFKTIVRRFGEASRKNRMLFVEALFSHPKVEEHCLLLDNVYEAPEYILSKKRSYNEDNEDDYYNKKNKSNNNSEIRSDLESADEDFGDQFDENTMNDIYKQSSKNIKDQKKKKKLEKEQRQKSKQKRAENKEKKKKELKRQAKEWLPEEDVILKAQFAIYAGSSSVFANISMNEDLIAIGRNRSAAQIESRSRILKLHETHNYHSSDDDLLNDSSSDKEESTIRQVDNSDSDDEIITQREDKDIANDLEISTQIEEDIEEEKVVLEEEEVEEPTNPWTEHEDNILKIEFDCYKSSFNVYEIIAEGYSQNFNFTRSSKEIAKRCKDLDIDVSAVPQRLPTPVKIIKKKAPRKSTKNNNNSINSEINKIQVDEEVKKKDTLDDILNMEIDNTVPSKFDAPEDSDDDDDDDDSNANNNKRSIKSKLAKSGNKQHKISKNKKNSSPISENLNQSKEEDNSDNDMFNDVVINNNDDNNKKIKNNRQVIIESDDE